jgi:hypothetical protein
LISGRFRLNRFINDTVVAPPQYRRFMVTPHRCMLLRQL